MVNEAVQSLGWCETEPVSHMRELGAKLGQSNGEIKVIVVDCGLIEHLKVATELATLARMAPGTRIFALLDQTGGVRHAEQLVAAGAAASVSRSVTTDQLRELLKLVDEGMTVSAIETNDEGRTELPREKLSVRELQVLHGICCGLQNKEIAHGFRIKEVTVKMHVRGIIRKLEARNRTHAAMLARDRGLVVCDESSFPAGRQ
nr:LuxR C-terminal-related transcriptional regulator [Maritimibacter dapengensis]